MSGVLKYKKELLSTEHTSRFDFFISQKNIIPKDEEIVLEPKKYMVHKIDTEGKIEYCNRYFSQISGYDEEEIIGSPHAAHYHPDMPEAILDLVWSNIFHRKTTLLLLKGITAEGKYYWSHAEYTIQVNKAIDDIQGFFCYQQHVPESEIGEIDDLYRKLKTIEDRHGVESAIKYLNAFLEEQQIRWNEYISDMLDKSFASRISGLTRKLFSQKDAALTLSS